MKNVKHLTDEQLIEEFSKASLVRGHGALFIICSADEDVDIYHRCKNELLRRLRESKAQGTSRE